MHYEKKWYNFALWIVQISACCVLHYLCELQQEQFLDEWWLPPEINECNDNDDYHNIDPFYDDENNIDDDDYEEDDDCEEDDDHDDR